MPGVECIVLGTVQLGLGYGRRAGMDPPGERAAIRVLERAWALGIRAFDTASAYGNASERLAYWLSNDGRIQVCDITTKVATAGGTDAATVQRACAPFALAQNLTVLAHDAVDERRFAVLRSAASEFGAESGMSVYTPEQVTQAAQLGARRVQGPGSVVDRRQLVVAHEAMIPFDARSVFLQGVLLDDPKTAERRVSGMGAVAGAVARAAREAELRPASALLASMLGKLERGDRVVLGFDTPEQLECIPEALTTEADTIAVFEAAFLRKCPPIPPLALDPRSW